jgi:hypothetical protein
MKDRIATFNAENLFARFKFKGKRVKKPGGGFEVRPYTDIELREVVDEGWDVDATKSTEFSEDDRRITASAIRETNADVIGLEEIESLDTLKRFTSQRLGGAGYTYKLLIDGNDPRLIDVAVLSRFPFAYIRTHQFERTASNTSFVSRATASSSGSSLAEHGAAPVCEPVGFAKGRDRSRTWRVSPESNRSGRGFGGRAGGRSGGQPRRGAPRRPCARDPRSRSCR